jgi:diguanylate cyclase (GGDEF)-like protein
MTIQSIIKKAVSRLEREGKLLTPDFYAEAFCVEVKNAGMIVEDCNQVEKFSKTLHKDFQKDLRNYRIKTLSELTRFLISKLNRTNPSQCSDTLEATNELTAKILKAIELLHNKEASELAKKSFELINSGATTTQLEQFKQLWVNFTSNYDDTFLQTLSVSNSSDSSDLFKIISNANISSGDTHSANELSLEKISSLLISSFVPSIASKMDKKILQISEKIKNNPAILESETIEEEIKSAISLRIALDKKSVKEMVESLDGVLDKLSLRLIDMIESSDSSNFEIQKIKNELEQYNHESTTDFKVAHKKLYTIAVALEKNTKLLSKDLKEHSGDITHMAKKIKKLEAELAQTKEESKEDFLTKLYNRRALDEYFEAKEEEYKRYGHNYTVVMFDLDHFKSVNDTYGHDAGDAVLSAFAKIIKREARTVDVVGRFGGEEFMALLGDTDKKGAIIFAEKVRKQVQKARFMYKGKRIAVTVSCGVAERVNSINLDAVLKLADELLYKAKKDGRNRVAY